MTAAEEIIENAKNAITGTNIDKLRVIKRLLNNLDRKEKLFS